MPAKRLLFIQTQAENAGAQEIARLLSGHFTIQGYDVSQIFFYRKTKAFDNERNTFFCASERPSSLSALMALLRNLDHHMTTLKPDCVITFQHYGNIIGGLIARYHRIPQVIANQLSAPPTMPKAVRWVDRIMGQSGFFNHIVVNSADTLEEYRQWPSRYREKLVRIDHGFADKTSSISPQEARAHFGLPSGVPLLGCAARLHPLKRLDTAIALLQDNPGWHLALAGHGSERLALEKHAESCGAGNRVHFLGEVTPDAIGMFLAALDVFVFPSEAETFGLAAVEAAQAGVPVVANGLPVLREVLSDAEGNPCAVFVQANTPQDFSEAIRKVLADSELQQLLRQRSQTLKEKYSLGEMAQRYAQLIDGKQAPHTVSG